MSNYVMLIQYLFVIVWEDIPLRITGGSRGMETSRSGDGLRSEVVPEEIGDRRKIRGQRNLMFVAGSLIQKISHDFVRSHDLHFEIGVSVMPQKLDSAMT
jgi:hypothetical protein